MFLWVKERPTRKADNLTAICEPTVYKMWEPRRLTTLWAFTACYRDSFAFLSASQEVPVFWIQSAQGKSLFMIFVHEHVTFDKRE
jgi:hypothetical protein